MELNTHKYDDTFMEIAQEIVREPSQSFHVCYDIERDVFVGYNGAEGFHGYENARCHFYRTVMSEYGGDLIETYPSALALANHIRTNALDYLSCVFLKHPNIMEELEGMTEAIIDNARSEIAKAATKLGAFKEEMKKKIKDKEIEVGKETDIHTANIAWAEKKREEVKPFCRTPEELKKKKRSKA